MQYAFSRCCNAVRQREAFNGNISFIGNFPEGIENFFKINAAIAAGTAVIIRNMNIAQLVSAHQDRLFHAAFLDVHVESVQMNKKVSAVKLVYKFEHLFFTGGFIIACVIAVIYYFFLWKTRVGYKIRAVGGNPDAAECGGINSIKYSIIALMIAGAMAGIGGAIEIIGIHNRFYANFSSGYGFEGVAVSMLGGNHPFGIILSSLLFGALKSGSMAMQIQAGTNAELVKILQALVIFFIAGKWSILHLITRARKRRQMKKSTDLNTVQE